MFTHAIGARHSPLDNEGYSLVQKTLIKSFSPSEAVLTLAKEEEWQNVLSSLIICLFTRSIYIPHMVIECLYNLGIRLKEEELLQLGLEIQKLRIETKLRFGFNYNTLFEEIPQRIYEMPTAHGRISEKQFSDLFDNYKFLLDTRYSIEMTD